MLRRAIPADRVGQVSALAQQRLIRLATTAGAVVTHHAKLPVFRALGAYSSQTMGTFHWTPQSRTKSSVCGISLPELAQPSQCSFQKVIGGPNWIA
jgi:hypothetical protein